MCSNGFIVTIASRSPPTSDSKLLMRDVNVPIRMWVCRICREHNSAAMASYVTIASRLPAWTQVCQIRRERNLAATHSHMPNLWVVNVPTVTWRICGTSIRSNGVICHDRFAFETHSPMLNLWDVNA